MKKKKKKSNRHKDLKNRTIFTILAMFNITWYTVIVLIASFHDHAVQSDLTIAWFSAWTVELALLYGIKLHDKYTGEDCDEEEEEEDNSTEENDTCNDVEDFPSPQDESFNESSDDA